jgi:hypothetical protein
MCRDEFIQYNQYCNSHWKYKLIMITTVTCMHPYYGYSPKDKLFVCILYSCIIQIPGSYYCSCLHVISVIYFSLLTCADHVQGRIHSVFQYCDSHWKYKLIMITTCMHAFMAIPLKINLCVYNQEYTCTITYKEYITCFPIISSGEMYIIWLAGS